jgi:tetratricopeptide (TPR) repeat protein
LTEHPSLAEISALLSEDLAPGREREILLHLMFECADCLSKAPTNIRAFLSPGSQFGNAREENVATEAAIDRALRVAIRHQKRLDRERKKAKMAAKILAQGGIEATSKLPLRMGPLAKMEALLARSWDLRHDNPALMVQLALLAAECAEQLDARTYGAMWVCDFKCRAQAELGNAFRVIDQLERAQAALGKARRYFELGSQNEGLEIRLLELEASVCADSRKFSDACVCLAKVQSYHVRHGNSHLAGRALLKSGLYTGYAGHSERALQLLADSLKLIDGEQHPTLVYAARHNQILFLIDLGHFREAEKQLFLLRSLRHHAGGKVNELRFLFLEGRIDAGLGRSERAEKICRTIRESALDLNLAYDSALASLDLAAVLLAQRKAREATEEVKVASKIFIALRIDREAFMTVIMLRTACEMQLATQTMVEGVAKFLRRLENDPSARFEG